ncbi:fumarylacetoacetate hydrolase family protein [Thalassobacillus sp. CUG 92003]|uniref:fumarylacetoacetate hydrolase family protein n=1 Tax=Thalassobacillus sp. CUG 92003 TaxID=2736641 RepID=UPI00351A93E9
MSSLLEGGEESLKEAEDAVNHVISNGLEVEGTVVFATGAVKLEAPVGKPNKIICVGHNYREHILEMKRELPENPVLFAKFSNTISGPEAPIVKKNRSDQYDFEAEFAFVIGRQAKDVKEEDALDHVAGYTIANDVSVRDLQKRTLQWLQGKSVDGTLPLGPWLVTKDEVPDPHNLEYFHNVLPLFPFPLVFPKADVQRCVVHKVRNALNGVRKKDIKGLANRYSIRLNFLEV